jgi:hypothetical protein
VSVAGLLYLVLGFSVGLSVAAAIGAKFFLPPSVDSSSRAEESEREPRIFSGKGNGETPTIPAQLEMHVARFPAPEDVRDQLVFADQLWPQMIRLMNSELVHSKEWSRAALASRAFEHMRMTQEKLDLTTPHLDYTQIVRRTRPEDMERLLREVGRSGRPA